ELAALSVAFLGVLFFWHRGKDEKSLTNESVIGLVYVLSCALGLILIAKNPRIEASGIDLLKGNILYTTTSDLILLSIMTVVILPLHILLFKEFLFVSFDRETAHTTKLRTNLYEFILYLTIGITVALCMRVGGILFVFGSLVIPPLIGLILIRRIGFVFLFSVIAAVVSAVSGIFLSYFLDLPSTPAILCIYGLVFILVSFCASIFK
ncbi:MAG: metal ABC transporter permease, partial [Endomicrobiia bacterium]|nr:metal ABC transporter permease [Endomicrobiia bacterium]